MQKYNLDHNIEPQALRKNKKSAFNVYGTIKDETPAIAADPVIQFMSKDQILKNIEMVKEQMQKAAKELGYKSGDFPNTEVFSKTMISLPIYPELTDEEVYYVVEKVNSFNSK